MDQWSPSRAAQQLAQQGHGYQAGASAEAGAAYNQQLYSQEGHGYQAGASAEAGAAYNQQLYSQEKSLAQANSLKLEGNKLYASSKYEEALERYADALEILSEDQTTNEIRAICYSNRAICFLQLEKFKEAVTETSKALEINPTYVKALLRRAQAQEKLDNLDEAVSDMKKVLELDPGNKQARDAVRQLEPRAAEKREKLKEEMIGKLKELGNNVLGRFGMSLDNFKTVQDPNTGSYSISFQR